MKRWVAVVAVAMMLGACGPTKDPGSEGLGDNEGAVRLNLNGNNTVGDTMAYVVIRNVFDHSQNYLVECGEKAYQLEGSTFCDELLILPPGVYEIIVQSLDPNCRTEQDHYKVVVKAGSTVELEINLICGGANGGLDLLVVKSKKPPVFEDIDFKIGDQMANKFICQYGDDVTISVTVTDEDTDCDDLTFKWYADGVLVAGAPYPVPIASAGTTNHDGNTCRFEIVVDSGAPLSDLGPPRVPYELKLKVSDGESSASFSFPVYIIDCGNEAPTP
jgi:hypothetical protein